MSDLGVAMVCVPALFAIYVAWDSAKRHFERVNAKTVDAIRNMLDELSIASSAHTGALDAYRQQAEELRRDLVELRDHNTAELAAMKTAFDRFTAKDAIQSWHEPHGPNARPY